MKDLFAALVLALECLARAVEQGIFTLDMLLDGKLALPEGKPLDPCFVRLGFSARPQSAEDVRRAYRALAKTMHPDAGGDAGVFQSLVEDYKMAMDLMGGPV